MHLLFHVSGGWFDSAEQNKEIEPRVNWALTVIWSNYHLWCSTPHVYFIKTASGFFLHLFTVKINAVIQKLYNIDTPIPLLGLIEFHIRFCLREKINSLLRIIKSNRASPPLSLVIVWILWRNFVLVNLNWLIPSKVSYSSLPEGQDTEPNKCWQSYLKNQQFPEFIKCQEQNLLGSGVW